MRTIFNSHQLKPHECLSTKKSDFIQSIDVVCPRCSNKALVSGGKPTLSTLSIEDTIRFTCIYCGHGIKYSNTPKFPVYKNSKGITKYARILFFDSQTDPYFSFSFWYRVKTPWGTLWAYNLEHLEIIEHYITQTDRSRNRIPIQNDSIASRLPQWAKSAKNREILIKIIKLKKSSDNKT